MNRIASWVKIKWIEDKPQRQEQGSVRFKWNSKYGMCSSLYWNENCVNWNRFSSHDKLVSCK